MRFLVLLTLAACGSSTASVDASGDGTTADVVSGDPLASCTGQCKNTALTAAFKSTRTLDSAYFGVTSQDGSLHIEAYRRAGSGCPTMSSPTADYTLVISSMAAPTSTAPLTSPVNILDFKGDLLNNALGLAATMETLTPVAYSAGNFVAVDVNAVFSQGTVSGHLYATHCASLDG
jgi:hypothetical protein